MVDVLTPTRTSSLIAACLLLVLPFTHRTGEALAGPVPRIAPGPVVIQVESARDRTPVPAVLVRLGGRHQATSAEGAVRLDGVPAGSYPLAIAHLGFERLERTISVPAGRREPIVVSLAPVTPASVDGVVLLAGIDQALAGARIDLTPVAVRAAVQGSYRLAAGWDGKFKIAEVPPGRYRASVRAPGCHAIEPELDVVTGMASVTFKLERESEPARLAVSVRDSSGTAVPGARVTLAEAGTAGAIAEAVSAADGTATCEGVALGRLNRADAHGRLAVARRLATVSVEAAGFETAVANVQIGASAAVPVQLNATARIEEREPNDTLAAAQPIRTGAPVTFKIARPNDRDVFRFHLGYPSKLKVEVGPANPIQTLVHLTDSAGKSLADRGTQVGENNTITTGGLPPGDYQIQVEEWGTDASSDTPLTLTVSATPAPDAHEPNDVPDQARVVRTGEVLRGCLVPAGDVDWYRFEVKRPAHVRLTMPPHALQRLVTVTDLTGRTLADRGVQVQEALDLLVALPPGTFRVAVREWGQDAESVEPYALTIDEAEDDGIDDPEPRAGRMTAVRELPLGGLVASTVFPTGDVDAYAVSVESAGRLHVESRAPTQLALHIVDLKGRELTSTGAQITERAHCQVDLAGPSTVFVRVQEWGDDACSVEPYVVRAWFEPCDEMEASTRNDTAGEAVPVELAEPIRGSLLPRGDADWYELEVDHPGWLRVEGVSPTQLLVRLCDARRRELVSRGSQLRETLVIDHAVLPGKHYLEVREWGDDATCVDAYSLTPTLRRAEPMETVPLANDPVRALALDEAQAFWIDHLGDRDRFVADAPRPGSYHLRVRARNQILLRVYDDRAGKRLVERGAQVGEDLAVALEAKGPTRYRIELTEWGDDDVSREPGFVIFTEGLKEIPAEWVTARADPYEPTRVTFTRVTGTGLTGGTGLTLPARGSDEVEARTEGPTLERRYAAEGSLPEVAWIQGDGVRTKVPLWVDASGARERTGVHVLVDHPAEGAVVDSDAPVRARAASYTGSRIANVSFAVDGRAAGVVHSAPFLCELPWSTLAPGEHTLTAVATDARGNTGTTTRRFGRSEFFGLTPPDGAVISGNEVRVSWTGAAFGPALVRYREKGTEAWTQARGEDGRVRAVRLTALEAGKSYELQPLAGTGGAGEPGPVRSVTRVKGLAFGRTKYGAAIRRDYDQKAGISVRNHGDQPLTVRLECGKPEDPALLVGFVGEGSVGAPVPLSPGEEREFWLGLSAQDVNRAEHRFPIRLTSASGLSDEAEVEVSVKLPTVKFEWEVLGPATHGLGQRYRLHNRGDGVTDLSITSGAPGVVLSPAVEHAPFGAGTSLDLVAHAVLSPGFTGVESTLTARAVDKQFTQPFKVALREGEKVFQVHLLAGGDEAPGVTKQVPASPDAAAQVETLDPAGLDWSRRTDPEDTDADGKADRWSLRDEAAGVVWVGDDTDADGTVDAVHADVGADGAFEYAALSGPDGWERTNIVDAWLEVAFALPWARTAYEKHDVDVVFNGQVVGRLRDTIPEGNYTFRVPPRLIRFGQDGTPEGNTVGIDSRHLRGGHYVVSSDYRFKVRLTSTPVFVVAGSEAAAREQAARLEGVRVQGTDLSVSSTEIQLVPATGLTKGSDVAVEVPVRSLGATCPARFDAALVRFEPGAPGVEVARVTVPGAGAGGVTRVSVPWKAAAGAHNLKLVVDPDNTLGDTDRTNNEAVIAVQVPGDDARPALTLHAPADGAAVTDPILPVTVEATDDSGFVQVAVRIDGGLWQPAGGPGRHDVPLLLQPGAHDVRVRATDGGGNQEERALKVTVNTTTPQVAITAPRAGASIDATTTDVELSVGGDTILVGARVEGGAWRRGRVEAGSGRVSVPLRFGPQTIEVIAAGPRGALGRATVAVVCTRQPTAEEAGASGPAASEPGIVDVAGVGPVDLFGPPSGVLAPGASGGGSLDRVARPDALAAGQKLVFRGTGGEGYVVAEFTVKGVVLTHVKADGTLVARGEGALVALDEEGTIFHGATEVAQASRVGRVQYGFHGDGTLLQTTYSRGAKTSAAVWSRAMAVGDPRPWMPAPAKEGSR